MYFTFYRGLHCRFLKVNLCQLFSDFHNGESPRFQRGISLSFSLLADDDRSIRASDALAVKIHIHMVEFLRLTGLASCLFSFFEKLKRLPSSRSLRLTN